MSETISMQSVYEEIKFIKEHMVSRDDFNSLLETFEIFHNPQTVKQLIKSEKDIKTGKVKRARTVRDILEQ
ncbi:hypothetical protein HZA97_05265 [Candidatus Woesearchaeota archaeon]|nr:hypothetical protein [Candidatus Woesearchaeota archaeon]